MCGVIGIIGPKSEEKESFWAAYECYRGLLTLQHRGQDAAGLLSFNDYIQKFYVEKDLGLVAQVFDEEKIRNLRGNMSLGHTRYATTGSDDKVDLQPLVTGFPFGVGLVHNGNIVNYHRLAKKLNSELGLQLLTNNDLELLLHMWCYHVKNEAGPTNTKITFDDCIRASREIFNEVDGAYAVVGMMAGVGMFGLRDPHGIRPLVLGKRVTQEGKTDYCLTSETISLNFLGYEYVRDIKPGEVILIDDEGNVFSEVVQQNKTPSPCMFEWIYFAGAESTINQKSVYTSRLNLGTLLAKKAQVLMSNNEIKPDFVCPVPDTSRTSSIALAEELGLPYREGLIKNRYIQRSFILNTQEAREKAVELKLSPVKSEIEGKNILLVDDSVVRGTTSKKIIALLKKCGANEITLAITCPPIRYGCFYGIDFPSPEDLIANGKTEEQIAEWVGANKVIYMGTEDLQEAIGLKDMCMACLDKKYPTALDDADEFINRRNELK